MICIFLVVQFREDSTTTSAKKKFGFCQGGYAPPHPPIWACWGRPRGGYHPWGIVHPFWDEKIIVQFFPKPPLLLYPPI